MKKLLSTIALLWTVCARVSEGKSNNRWLEPSCSENKVEQFHLVNPVTDKVEAVLDSITDLHEFTRNSEHGIINILAKTCSPDDSIKCVKFFLDDKVVKVEHKEPYTIFGKRGGILPQSEYGKTTELKACTYTDAECSLGQSGCLTLTGYIWECNVDEDIFAFDSETDTCIGQLNALQDDILCLSQSVEIAIVAIDTNVQWFDKPLSKCIDDVHIELTKPDGTKDAGTEYKYPWSLYGNKRLNFYGRRLPPGGYSVSAWANDAEHTKYNWPFKIVPADDSEHCPMEYTGHCERLDFGI